MASSSLEIFDTEELSHLNSLILEYVHYFKNKVAGTSLFVTLNPIKYYIDISNKIIKNISIITPEHIEKQARYIMKHFKDYEVRVDIEINPLYNSWDISMIKKYYVSNEEKDYLDNLIQEYKNYLKKLSPGQILYATLRKTNRDTPETIMNKLKMRAENIAKYLDNVNVTYVLDSSTQTCDLTMIKE